ncbi:hypothetical protein BXZ70DRAFT_927368 [Cristinia sonorae]|uniref:F-box domain-containing protein n=1 Tax=Cristinia sonorae TaxID=1940300 RepID=A0A8K0UTF7_9AGAR|nr:hypothetical protein BXZ70DRAFT_927368 [Cristinia sonorae]
MQSSPTERRLRPSVAERAGDLEIDAEKLLKTIQLYGTPATAEATYTGAEESSELLHASRIKRLVDIEMILSNAIKEAQRRLVSDINQRSKVNRLPEHIMSHIFRLVSEEPMNSMTSGVDVVNIARTCARWREIAVKTTSIWARIELGPLTRSFAQLFLSRSGQSPLTVILRPGSTCFGWPKWSEDGSEVEQRLAFCARHLHRIQRLQLQLAVVSPPSWLWTQPAPMLKHLILDVPHDKNDPSKWLILPGLFDNGGTALRSLSLRGYQLRWQAVSQMTHLTRLDLVLCSTVNLTARRNKACMDDSNVLKLLRKCTFLEELSLRCYSPLQKLPEYPKKPIVLARLRTLSLNLFCQDLHFILSSIHTAPELQLSIVFQGELPALTCLPTKLLHFPCITQCRHLSADAAAGYIMGSFSQSSWFVLEPSDMFPYTECSADFAHTSLFQLRDLNALLQVVSFTFRDSSTSPVDIDAFIVLLRHALSSRNRA